MTPNIPLLRKAVEWAEAEALKDPTESEWIQDFWRTTPQDYTETYGETRCGTAYCIAGYMCQISGLSWVTSDDVLVDGEPTFAGTVAARLLGLPWERARDLFQGYNTIEDVRRIANEIAAEAGERLSPCLRR